MPNRVLHSSPSNRYWQWRAAIRDLQATPGKWVRMRADAPARLIDTVRQRRNPQLRRDDGYLEAHGRNFTTDRDGVRRCDLYLRWIARDPLHSAVESSR